MMTFSASWPCASTPEADLSPHTFMRVGGRVEWFLEPTTPEELRSAVSVCRERGITPRILGGGANLIIADGILPGVVIGTGRMNRLFRIGSDVNGEGSSGEKQDPSAWSAEPSGRVAPADPALDPRLVGWAGTTLPSLVRAARDLSYGGIEGVVGIPGHLGGGVAMNAGGRWGELWDHIELVRVIDEEGEFLDLTPEQVQPGYRNSNLGERVVAAAILRFEPTPKALIEERMREILRQKNAVQPVSERSAGCVFKNPDREVSGGRGAGRLVEDCGLKGRSIGDAMVSPLHGNFVVNRGAARATDVLALIEEVRAEVAQQTGIELELEVKRWLD